MRVSGRVVKTLITSSASALAAAPSASAGGVTPKSTYAPSERPIQFSCAVFVPSGQSTPLASRSSARRSAYAVIFRTHWRSGIRTTGKLPRSERPSMISSLASTVPSSGHQLTSFLSWKARPRLKSCRKIHWVHLTYPTSVVASSRSQSYEKPSDLSCRLKFPMFSLVVSSGCVPVLIACCSAGRPKESQPMGCSTSKSFIRQYRAMMSEAV
mmetsp:Transcript_16194/g.38514  ORF Transcript_16194/g.38514 Transcript_16194/m.38514 type:complete len:212 (-) Transcript_16194:376-1011(-)